MKTRHVFDECEIPLPHDGPCVNAHIGGEWVDWNDLPQEPWNEIVPGLFIGSSTDQQPTGDDFDAVLTLWNRAPKVVGVEERRWEIPDLGMPDLAELADAVGWVYERWAVDQFVLVRCQAGLNRSSLVVASTMIHHGYTPTQAIDKIRTRRSQYTLCNQNFLNYLVGLERQMGNV